MGSSRYSQGDQIITDPDYMTRDSLFEISLTQLSKSLLQTTSSRATLSIYLRWLEVHRREPTKRTEHWNNTLLHWTQSLRSRGFREHEIVAAVEDWKDANGPFRSEWRRYPPSPKEITKAFDEMMERSRERERERSRERDLASRLDRPLGDSYRPKESSHGDGSSPHRPRYELNKVKKMKRQQENFDGKPPPNYICNRCGKKGHYLQVCPTNLDPNYDRPPAADYECEICKAVGKHFKSLCPRNSDPYSIIQKRRAQNILTPSTNKGKVFREWKKEVEEQEEAERRERRHREQEEDNRRGRRHQERNFEGRLTQESPDGSSASSTSSPRLKNSRLEKLQEIEETKARIIKGDSVDIDEIMAGSRRGGEGDKDRKRPRPEDDHGAPSRGISPNPSLGGRVRKKARTGDSDGTTSSPRRTMEMAASPMQISHSNSGIETLDTINNDSYSGTTEKNTAKTGNDDFDTQLKSMQNSRGLREMARQAEGAKQDAKKAERIQTKRESTDRPLTIKEEGYASKNCIQFNNGYDCPRASTGCPYYHDNVARQATLAGKENRRQEEESKFNPDVLVVDESDTDCPQDGSDIPERVNNHGGHDKEKTNPDEMDIDESVTDTSEEMDIEITRPPKQYSEFVQKLMLKRMEMSEIVNAVKRRPTAVDMWKFDDQRRMDKMDSYMPDLVEPSPPYSPWKSENDESSPLSHVITLRYIQLDGGHEECPSDETISQDGRCSPEHGHGMHRKIEKMDKDAIAKVKDITSRVAGDLQTDTKAVSPYRASLRGADTTCVERSTSEKGPSIHQDNASSSADNSTRTEEKIKELVPEARAVVHASENSFGSLIVNLPGDRPDIPRKSPTSNPTQYAGPRSIESMQNRDMDYGEATVQEGYVGSHRTTSTTSDATDLQSLRDLPNPERKAPASQEATKGRGAGLSDISNIRKIKAKKQDDQSRAQRRTSKTKHAENKDEMTAASGDT